MYIYIFVMYIYIYLLYFSIMFCFFRMDHCIRLLEEIDTYQEAEFLKGNVNIMANPELKNCPTNLLQIQQKIMKNHGKNVVFSFTFLAFKKIK